MCLVSPQAGDLLVETESEGGLRYPVSPVEVEVVATGMSLLLLPDGESCVITTMSQTGKKGEEECHRGIHGTRGGGQAAGGEQADQDSARGVEMT